MSATAAQARIDFIERPAFGELSAEWEELLQRSYDNRIFLGPTWHQIWWQYLGSGAPAIFLLREGDGRLAGLLPLRTLEEEGRRILTFAGSPDVTDYMDALAEKQRAEDILSSLWKRALAESEPDLIRLRHVPSTSPLILTLKRIAEEEGLEITIEDDEVCPVAILCANWDGYLQMLSKKARHEIRRKLRRAQQGADWAWRTTRKQEELDQDLKSFFRLHEASTAEKARFMTPDMRDFFCAVAKAMLERDALRLSIFSRDAVDIAATISFVYRDRYLLYNAGYDPAYAAYSPGIAAVALAMQDAINEKAVAFDFLSGSEHYKYQFGATDTYTCQVEMRR